MTAVVCEIDNQHNQSLYFRPIQRSVRGRFDYLRCGEPMAKVVGASEPGPIPSQRIGFDLDRGVGFVEETLHAPEHKAIRERIERRGRTLPPEREDFPDADESTWLFWLGSAVKAGIAKIVSGKLPEKLKGKPKVNFITNERRPENDRLAAAIEKQNTLFEALLAELKKRS